MPSPQLAARQRLRLLARRARVLPPDTPGGRPVLGGQTGAGNAGASVSAQGRLGDGRPSRQMSVHPVPRATGQECAITRRDALASCGAGRPADVARRLAALCHRGTWGGPPRWSSPRPRGKRSRSPGGGADHADGAMLCAWTATDRRSTVLPWRRHEGAGVEHDRPRAPAADHPLAAELAARGHEVQWIGGPADRDVSALKGVRVTAGGLHEHERHLKLVELRPDLGSLPPRARRRAAFSTAFAELSVPSLLGTLRRSVDVWRPDVVVQRSG